MRHWWVNQNQTYEQEVSGGFLWSPKRNRNGGRNQFYENMREVSPGDQVFSFRNRMIGAVGVAESYCYEAPRPDEFGPAGQNWDRIGWRVDVAFTEVPNPITPKAHIDRIRPLLPDRYSPLQQNGDGLQSVYLAEISKDFAGLLTELLRSGGNQIPVSTVAKVDGRLSSVQESVENRIESEIRQSQLTPTEKDQLVKARRGQGRFRENVQKVEKGCRITRVMDPRFLIASHIKPWRDCGNEERLDGENGLLLSPTTDFLFDRGFISFDDQGTLLLSPVAARDVLTKLGVPVETVTNVGSFTEKQKQYLAFHRREVFLKAGQGS